MNKSALFLQNGKRTKTNFSKTTRKHTQSQRTSTVLGRFAYMGPTLLETMAQVHMSHSFRITRYCSKKRKHCAIAEGSLDRLVKVPTITCVAGVLFGEREEKLPKRARSASRRLSASKPVCKNSFLVLKVFTRKMWRKIKEYL